jgi:DNA-binding GntR family transcriptional regulator
MTIFSPSERQVVEKTSVALVRTIRAAILDGRLAPNQPLKEVELAKQLGTSRTPIREALLLLERDGLVEAQPNRGATVKMYHADELEELYTLRAVLEGHAARMAASRITDRALRELDESCERFARLATAEEVLPELVDENFTFHETILKAAGSDRLIRMVREVTAVPPIYKSYMAYSPENRRTVEIHHRSIAEALREHDGDEACARMTSHVIWARGLSIAHFPGGPDPAP